MTTKMSIFMMWLLMAMIGMGACIFGAVIGPPIGVAICLMGGFMMLFPIINLISEVKKKGLLPIIRGVGDNEKLSFFITDNNEMIPIPFNNKNEGILQRNGIGMIEDKGTTLVWGDTPVVLIKQGCGVGIDLRQAQYISQLTSNGIEDYEAAIKQYLGPAKYVDFCNKFRVNPQPDELDIKRELQYLVRINEPHDPLSQKVIGESINFKNWGRFLEYAYNPISAINAYEGVKIAMKRENMQYNKGEDKAMGFAKAFAVIAIVVVIVLVALQNIDLKGILPF